MPREATPDELPVLLLRAAKAMLAEVREAAGDEKKDSSMTPVHGFAARFIASQEEPTAADLAHHLGVTRQSASEVVAALEDAGYVHRRPHPADGRSQILELTDRGRTSLEASRGRWSAVERHWAGLVGPDELVRVRAALDRYLADRTGH